MKNWVVLMAMLGWGLYAAAQGAGFQLEGIGSVMVPVTGSKMTNIIFPEPIQTGVKVSREVLAQKVKGVENVIELKAVKRGFVPTNLSVYGRDGRLYSFTLRYVDDTSVLNYRVTASEKATGGSVLLTGLPASLPAGETTLHEDADRLRRLKPFLNVCKRVEGLRLRLTGIYLRDSLEWLVFALTNKTVIPYRPDGLRTYLLDSKQVKRKAQQQVDLDPVYMGGWSTMENTARMAVGFEPFTVLKGKRLVVEVVGKDGSSVQLKIKAKHLLKTRKV